MVTSKIVSWDSFVHTYNVFGRPVMGLTVLLNASTTGKYWKSRLIWAVKAGFFFFCWFSILRILPKMVSRPPSVSAVNRLPPGNRALG